MFLTSRLRPRLPQSISFSFNCSSSPVLHENHESKKSLSLGFFNFTFMFHLFFSVPSSLKIFLRVFSSSVRSVCSPCALCSLRLICCLSLSRSCPSLSFSCFFLLSLSLFLSISLFSLQSVLSPTRFFLTPFSCFFSHSFFFLSLFFCLFPFQLSLQSLCLFPSLPLGVPFLGVFSPTLSLCVPLVAPHFSVVSLPFEHCMNP